MIWSNPAVTADDPGQALWGRFYRTVDESRPVVRPLPVLVHRAELSRFYQDRTPFQRTLVGLHATVAILLLAALLATGVGTVPSALAALVFAIHPGLTASVLRMEGISEVLCLGFILLAVMAMSRAFAVGRTERPWAWMVASWLAMICALLSKEAAFAVVPALLAWTWVGTRPPSDGTEMSEPRPASPTPSTATLLITGTIAVALLALAYRMVSMGQLEEGHNLARFVTPDTGTGMGRRLLFGLAAWAEYARLLVFPLGLAYTYDFLYNASGFAWWARLAGGTLVFLAALIAFVTAISKRHAASVLWSGLLVTGLFAGAGIVGSVGDFASERSMYFIVPGFLGLLAAAWTSRAPHVARTGLVATVVSMLVIGLFTARTMNRNNDFVDENTLQEAQLRDHPDSAEPYFEMGNRFLTLQQWGAARARYEDAIERRDNHWMAWVNLGAAYAGEGETGLAIRCYDRAIQGMEGQQAFASPMARAQYNRALEYMKQNRNREAAEALERTLEIFPNHLLAHANLAFIYANSADYRDQAIEHFERALELETDESKRTVLTKNLRRLQTQQKEAEAKKPIEVDPDQPQGQPQGQP